MVRRGGCGFDSRWALLLIGEWDSLARPVATATDRWFKSNYADSIAVSCVGTGGRLLTAFSQVRFLPPQLLRIRKGKPIGDGSCLENSRAMSLEGSTPSPSAL